MPLPVSSPHVPSARDGKRSDLAPDAGAERGHQRLENGKGRGDRAAVIDRDRFLRAEPEHEERHCDAMVQMALAGRTARHAPVAASVYDPPILALLDLHTTGPEPA